MPLRVRDIDVERKFCQELKMEALQRVIPRETIDAVLTQYDAQAARVRKLSMLVVVWVVLAMHLYPRVSIPALLAKLGHGLRLLWPELTETYPTASALTYRRYQLGAPPLAALFHQICVPLATPDTPGAFRGRFRLMAIDGSVKDLPDTAANVAAFGRHGTDRGAAAFPQLTMVTLTECGTHAVVDAGFWPCHTSERVGALRLLRSVGPGMLLLVDRGLYSFAMLARTRERGAHVLFRVPAGPKFPPVRVLADGSTLVWVEETTPSGKKTGQRLLMRLIEYTLTDPARPGDVERHRLLTSLLNPRRHPAQELAELYHERWETELTIDEQDTHQRLVNQPLRSQKPVGVIQELYGMLLAHYAIRFLMHEAALGAQIAPTRLSFVHALRVVEDALSDFEIPAPELLPWYVARLLQDIAAGRLPARRNRICPRVVKRKMSKWPLKREEHRRVPQPSCSFQEAIVLICPSLAPNSVRVRAGRHEGGPAAGGEPFLRDRRHSTLRRAPPWQSLPPLWPVVAPRPTPPWPCSA